MVYYYETKALKPKNAACDDETYDEQDENVLFLETEDLNVVWELCKEDFSFFSEVHDKLAVDYSDGMTSTVIDHGIPLYRDENDLVDRCFSTATREEIGGFWCRSC
jgi:hypothetical protein